MGIVSKIKEENKLEFPRILQLEITQKCPFNCPQCYKCELEQCDVNLIKLKKSINEAKSNGTKLIVLNGGEPLLHKNFIELSEYILDLGMIINCFSSGYGLNNEIVEIFKNDNANICISLNGSTEKINKLSREGYNYSIDAIKKLKKEKVKYGINWVARRDNVDDFYNLIKIAEKFNAIYISICLNKLTHGRMIDSQLTEKEYIKLREVVNTYTGNIKLLIENCYIELSEFLGIKTKALLSGCGAGRTLCNITISGKYAPCTHLHYEEEFSSIAEYWNNSKVLERIRKRKIVLDKECKKCRKKTYCKYCLAETKNSYYNFNAAKDSCVIKEEI